MDIWSKGCGAFPQHLPKNIQRCERNGLTGESQIIFVDNTRLEVYPDISIPSCGGKWTDTWTRDLYHANEVLQTVNDKNLKKKSRHNDPLPIVDGRRMSNRFNVPRADPGYIFSRPMESGDIPLKNNPYAKSNVFIGLAISGGGTRAANFGLAVIEQLEDLGIMSHVSAISSVSGGSVAAAYYGLFGSKSDDSDDMQRDAIVSHDGADRVQFWTKAKADLLQDIRTDWIHKYLTPTNLIATTFTSKNRTDILADVFDKALFHGKTFDDLGGFGPLRPLLSFNATTANELRFHASDALAARGPNAPSLLFQSFSFNKDSFDDLGSDLSSVKISSAVAASAAFPGVFDDLTLASYGRSSDSGANVAGYLHLFDGGPSDNLGVDALSDIAARWFTTYAGSSAPPNGCLLIVVDAFPSQTGRIMLGDQRDPRRFYDHLIDFNFMDATDALLQRRREDSLAQLGVPLVAEGEYSAYYETRTPDLPSMLVRQGHLFNDKTQLELGMRANDEDATFALQNGDDYIRSVTCAVWHISLDDIRAVSLGSVVRNGKTLNLLPGPPDFSMPPNGNNSTSAIKEKSDQLLEYARKAEEAMNEFAELPETQFRDSVWQIASRTKTDFDLVGPPGCSKQIVQDALWDAARIAVYDDFETRQKVCAWMTDHNVEPSIRCAELQEDNRPARYPVGLVKVGQSYGVVGCLPGAGKR
jgi:predicted acylesterase/phospholipase RssA